MTASCTLTEPARQYDCCGEIKPPHARPRSLHINKTAAEQHNCFLHAREAACPPAPARPPASTHTHTHTVRVQCEPPVCLATSARSRSRALFLSLSHSHSLSLAHSLGPSIFIYALDTTFLVHITTHACTAAQWKCVSTRKDVEEKEPRALVSGFPAARTDS